MGMRATIARITKSGKVVCTSVQWSTRLDNSIAHELTSTRGDKQAAMKRLFTEITKFEHVSSVEPAGIYEKSVYTTETKVSAHMSANGVQTDIEDSKERRVRTAKQLNAEGKTAKQFIQDFHFEDGITAIYNEATPEVIEFGWDSYGTPDVVFETLTLTDLANGVRTTYSKN